MNAIWSEVRTALVCTVLALGLASCIDMPPDPDREDWISLFDGRSLDGWTPTAARSLQGENAGGLFQVVDGQLVVSDGVLIHDRVGSFYRLRVEYRFLGGEPGHVADRSWRRAGILVHAQDMDAKAGTPMIPPSVEVELLGGDGQNDRPTANLCPRGMDVSLHGEAVTRACVSSASETHHGEEWVRLDIDVLGAERVDHIVDGVRVLSWSRPMHEGRIVTAGRVGLHAGRDPVAFRRVDLLPLRGCTDPRAGNHKAYFLSTDNADCAYD